MKTCKTCVYYCPRQRDLNYLKDVGVCIAPHLGFNIENGRLVGVVDTENQKDRTHVTGNTAHDFEHTARPMQIKHSRYLLQVSDEFGCVKHELNSEYQTSNPVE